MLELKEHFYLPQMVIDQYNSLHKNLIEICYKKLNFIFDKYKIKKIHINEVVYREIGFNNYIPIRIDKTENGIYIDYIIWNDTERKYTTLLDKMGIEDLIEITDWKKIIFTNREDNKEYQTNF